MFIVGLKSVDVVEPVPAVQDKVPATPVVRRPEPPAGRPWPGGGERRDGHGKGGHGVDARRRRSGASRFRG